MGISYYLQKSCHPILFGMFQSDSYFAAILSPVDENVDVFHCFPGHMADFPMNSLSLFHDSRCFPVEFSTLSSEFSSDCLRIVWSNSSPSSCLNGISAEPSLTQAQSMIEIMGIMMDLNRKRWWEYIYIYIYIYNHIYIYYRYVYIYIIRYIIIYMHVYV